MEGLLNKRDYVWFGRNQRTCEIVEHQMGEKTDK